MADLERGSPPESDFPLEPIVQIVAFRDNARDDHALLVIRDQRVHLIELICAHELQNFGPDIAAGIARQ